MNLNSKCTEFYFDENLRDVPLRPEELSTHVEKLKSELESQENLKLQVRTMGEIGVYLRQLMQLRLPCFLSHSDLEFFRVS